MVRSDEDWKWIDGKITEVYDKVMDLLKDFQRATVLRVSELFENGQDRVLVAEEVGMGKTMVAKGVIAAMARLHATTMKMRDILIPARIISIMLEYNQGDCTMEECCEIYLKEYLASASVMEMDKLWI